MLKLNKTMKFYKTELDFFCTVQWKQVKISIMAATAKEVEIAALKELEYAKYESEKTFDIEKVDLSEPIITYL